MEEQNINSIPQAPQPASVPQGYDLPRSVVVIMVVLAVVISVLGTWTVMQEINYLRTAPVAEGSVAYGSVSLNIAQPELVQTAEAQGKVSLTIKEAS